MIWTKSYYSLGTIVDERDLVLNIEVGSPMADFCTALQRPVAEYGLLDFVVH